MLELRRPLTRCLLLASCLALPAVAQTPTSTPAPTAAATTTPAPTGTTAKPAPAAPATPAAEPDRIDFQLKFPAERGGGSASGSAVNLEYKRDDYAVLSGAVKVHYQDIDIQAEKAEIDLSTKIVTAEGNVILDQGPKRLTGDSAVFDLNTKTGSLTNSTAHVAADYFFSGSEVKKTGENTYTVKNGTFTSCSQTTPDWSFRLSEAEVEVDGYARVHNATMRAKKLPVFYAPYILWPVKSERSSGFLVPNVGYSDRRGASLGLAYYQTLGRSYDTTAHVDLFTRNFLGVGDEFRYRPSDGTKGHVLGYMVRDSEALDQKWRWKVEWNHETTDLPWGMRGVVQYQDFSDFNFFRDFERDFDRNTLRFIDSRAFVTGNWGPHLLNVLLSDRQTFVGTTTTSSSVDQRKLPEIEYRLRSTQLWKTPFYLQFDGSVSYLDLSRPDSYSGQYGRVDAFPEVTLPIRTFPWLALSITGGERLTWYGQSLVQATPQSPRTLDGGAFSRTVPFGSAEIVGPSVSRIFDQGIFGLGKMKHVIEPRFTYTYLGDINDASRTPLFDDVDAIASTNSGRVALVNRILAKPKPKKKPVTAPAVTAAGATTTGTTGTAATAGTATTATPITGSAGTTVTPVGTSPGIAAPPPAGTTAAQTAAATTASLPAATMGTPASTASTSDSTGVPGAGNSVLPVNPVLATIPATEDEGSAREVFSLELARRISFDNQRPLQTSRNGQVQTTQGPLEASVRFNPSDRTSVRFEADYDTLFKGISSTQLSGDFSFGTGNSLTLTWFTAAIPELKKTTGDQVRVSGSAGIFKSLRIEGQLNYDFENKLLQEQRIVFNWTQQCYGLRLELRDFRSAVGPRTRDKDVRLSLSLKNVGTFLDLSGRSSTVEP